MKYSCRGCSGNNLMEVVNLGKQPIAHRLLSSKDAPEAVYPFVVYYCQSCGLVQICDPISPEELYLNYNYCFSSWKPEAHMEDEVDTTLKHSHAKSALEIACNDGKFLELLKERGMPQLSGIEPNPFASQVARDKGFAVYSEMLNKSLCEKLVKDYGKFDVVVARQVLEHLLDIKNFFECVNILLSEKGSLFIDIPDCEAGLSMGDVSVLWEEHVNYFTEGVIKNILLKFGFRPISVKRYNFSGVTLAILAERANSIVCNNQYGVGLSEKIREFAVKMNEYKKLLLKILDEYRRSSYKVVLYGVGCRACTVVNCLGVGDYFDFAVDDQPERQNKYMPGSRLLISSPEVLKDSPAPIVCLLAVNQENENIVKQKMGNISNSKIEFASLFSPNNIWQELKKLSIYLKEVKN